LASGYQDNINKMLENVYLNNLVYVELYTYQGGDFYRIKRLNNRLYYTHNIYHKIINLEK